MKQTNLFNFVKILKKLKNINTQGFCISGVLDLNNDEEISILKKLADNFRIDEIVVDLSENLSKSIYNDLFKAGMSIKINMYYDEFSDGGFFFNNIEEMIINFSLFKRKALKKILKNHSVYIRDIDYFLKTDKFNN